MIRPGERATISDMNNTGTARSHELGDSTGIALASVDRQPRARDGIHPLHARLDAVPGQRGRIRGPGAGHGRPIGIIVRNRWLVRVALLGFTAVTIVGWALIGPRFMLAYVDKGIEVALVALLVVEMFRYDGGPVAVIRRGIDLLVSIAQMPFNGRSAA